jgi:hypothetical protein
VVTIMDEIVAAVRKFMRDLIADAMGRLVVWGLEVLVAGGAGAGDGDAGHQPSRHMSGASGCLKGCLRCRKCRRNLSGMRMEFWN